jgi:hypothetical protein
MDEATGLAQFLPRPGLETGIDVPDHGSVAFRDEDRHILVAELRVQEPAVARLRVHARRHEPLRIEGVVRAQQQRAEMAERRHIGVGGAADHKRLR